MRCSLNMPKRIITQREIALAGDPRYARRWRIRSSRRRQDKARHSVEIAGLDCLYYHPSTTSATLYFRTVPIVPESIGRVAEVKADFSAPVKEGDVIFTLDSAKQMDAFCAIVPRLSEHIRGALRLRLLQGQASALAKSPPR